MKLKQRNAAALKAPNPILRTSMSFLAVLLATSAAQAAVVTINGGDVTLLSSTAPSNAVYDNTKGAGTSTGVTRTSSGALGQFDPTLGVLTNAVATSTPDPTVALVKTGGTGTANAYSTWSLGGNSSSSTTINQVACAQCTDFTWNPISVTSAAANLNNFVGTGNIASNSFSSYLTTYWSTGTLGTGAFTGTSLTNKVDLVSSESIDYTYRTHSNASFSSSSDLNGFTIDFGSLGSGTSLDQSFSIFNLGGLGLTNFSLSLLGGDNLFNVTGGKVTAGGSSSYNAHFNGQNPLALTGYDAMYRLTFDDDVSGLGQYASNSVGSNFIDIRMLASVAPALVVSEPESYTMMLAGFGLMGALARRRKAKQAQA